MEVKRTACQGVWNIIRFNWHFYLLVGLALLAFLVTRPILPENYRLLLDWLALFAGSTVVISLFVSFYIYDLSKLYQFPWLPDCDPKKLLNLHAGFDETSAPIRQKYRHTDISVCDFYEPEKHTELSLKRARKAYPPTKATIKVSTSGLPFEDHSFDLVLVIFAAHEIRNDYERIVFFKELNRVTKPQGSIYVTEHLRNLTNFLAYTLGFFHFHSKSTWLATFKSAGLNVRKEMSHTPFITTFQLEKHGEAL